MNNSTAHNNITAHNSTKQRPLGCKHSEAFVMHYESQVLLTSRSFLHSSGSGRFVVLYPLI